MVVIEQNHGTLNVATRRQKAIKNMDFYRRVPKDLTEATTLGAFMSILTMLIMGTLFVAETMAFFKSEVGTEIGLDDNFDPHVQINFNITMFEVQCDLVSVDVWDVLGTNRQNVTRDIEKWQLDENGKRVMFSGRNRKVKEVKTENHRESLEQLHANGVHATPIDGAMFDSFIKEKEIVFVNFFAPWCVWCQRLHPTWEKFAEAVEERRMPINVVTVNCVEEAQLCRQMKIMAFPTLRWFQGGNAEMPDYRGDRTVAALTSYAKQKLEINEKFKNWESNTGDRGNLEKLRELKKQSNQDPPGCQVSGSLTVNRVPGNFHILASSVNHNINAAMTNLTHRVNHLSFGTQQKHLPKSYDRTLQRLPRSVKKFVPLDGINYRSGAYHQAFHHFIKVVSTNFKIGADFTMYQFIEQSQLVFYDAESIPEARFSYDLSPMSVIVEREERRWYDYLTSLFAIIGGTFTTLGLIDATLYKVFKPKKL